MIHAWEPGPDWSPARIRFREGSKAQETPAAIWFEGKWLDVALVSGAYVQGIDPDSQTLRRFVVQDRKGRQFWLQGGADVDWRIRAEQED